MKKNETFDRIQKSFQNIELVNGLPNITKLKLDVNTSVPSLLIIDDLQTSFLDSQEMLQLLTYKNLLLPNCKLVGAKCIN